MHPDQVHPAFLLWISTDSPASVISFCLKAAESIVDFALAHNKSFAVVPCCEFARGLGFSVSVRIAVLDSPVVRALSSPPLARQTPFMSACGGDLVLIAGTYSQEFPKRKLHGVAVRTHEQLCDYLQV